MIIDCITDLHGHYPELEGGDLLIVAGDCTNNDSMQNWMKFFGWFLEQPYKKRIVVAGNHDNFLSQCSSTEEAKKLGLWSGENYDYLCDSGTEFEYEVLGGTDTLGCMGVSIYETRKLKIWGSPWTPLFKGVNPGCTAFMLPEAELEAKFALIPDDTDILVTHGPVFGILDEVERYKGGQIVNAGSTQLIGAIARVQPRYHICGHIHEGYGKKNRINSQQIENLFPYTTFINCSHVNERYEPVNKPIRVIL